jgi:hypothetical protein
MFSHEQPVQVSDDDHGVMPELHGSKQTKLSLAEPFRDVHSHN